MVPTGAVCIFTCYIKSVLLVLWTCMCSLETIYLVFESLKLWTDGSSQLIDTCTRTELEEYYKKEYYFWWRKLSYVWCMITEKEESQNNGEVPLLDFILQGLGLYLCIMDIY